jgi:hypothetical protein
MNLEKSNWNGYRLVTVRTRIHRLLTCISYWLYVAQEADFLKHFLKKCCTLYSCYISHLLFCLHFETVAVGIFFGCSKLHSINLRMIINYQYEFIKKNNNVIGTLDASKGKWEMKWLYTWCFYWLQTWQKLSNAD